MSESTDCKGEAIGRTYLGQLEQIWRWWEKRRNLDSKEESKALGSSAWANKNWVTWNKVKCEEDKSLIGRMLKWNVCGLYILMGG